MKRTSQDTLQQPNPKVAKTKLVTVDNNCNDCGDYDCKSASCTRQVAQPVISKNAMILKNGLLVNRMDYL